MSTELLDRATAEQLADKLVHLDGVAGLDGGRFGEVALLFPGNRVHGLHVTTPADGRQPHFEVYVIADGKAKPELTALAETVRKTVAEYTTLPIDVVISDVS